MLLGHGQGGCTAPGARSSMSQSRWDEKQSHPPGTTSPKKHRTVSTGRASKIRSHYRRVSTRCTSTAGPRRTYQKVLHLVQTRGVLDPLHCGPQGLVLYAGSVSTGPRVGNRAAQEITAT
eukprot:3293437-Rhodomonas_salina.2